MYETKLGSRDVIAVRRSPAKMAFSGAVLLALMRFGQTG